LKEDRPTRYSPDNPPICKLSQPLQHTQESEDATRKEEEEEEEEEEASGR
jgi:hypothetical protein